MNKKIVIAVTGASGAIYAQRLLALLASTEHEVEVILSDRAREVADAELEGGLHIPGRFAVHDNHSMQVGFVSGSAPYDAMVIVPCSMGTVGRIANGYSDSVIVRAADVFLKEKRTLIIVPREAPWNLLHARNVTALIEAGATLIPACPSFYGKPKTLEDAVDTILARILDQLDIEHALKGRWLKP